MKKAAQFVPIILLAGCAAMTQAVVPIGDADANDRTSVARIAVSTNRPVLLRAVDERFLAGVQVSSVLRSYAYVLHAGMHDLWVSNVPYGMPFLPQHLKCYVMHATLSAGAEYELYFDPASQRPVLRHTGGSEPQIEGQLVDEPLVVEQGCRWQ